MEQLDHLVASFVKDPNEKKKMMKMCNHYCSSGVHSIHRINSIHNNGGVPNTIVSKVTTSISPDAALTAQAAIKKLQKNSSITETVLQNVLLCLLDCSELNRPVQVSSWHHQPDAPSLEHNQKAPKISKISEAPIPGAVLSQTSLTYSSSISEPELLQDLIYCIQGLEGKYVLYDPLSTRYKLLSDSSPNNGTKELIQQIGEVGLLYKNIIKVLDNPTMLSAGLIFQGLSCAIRKELAEYLRIVTLIHNELNNGKNSLSLRKMVCWLNDPRKRLKLVCDILDSCKGGERKGGSLLNKLYDHVINGDRTIRKIGIHFIVEACRSWMRMVEVWICEGELPDPYGEFFIKQERTSTEFWHGKYSLVPNMIPSFISTKLAEQILLVGKSVNFIRTCATDHEWKLEDSVRELMPKEATVDEYGHNDSDAYLQQFVNVASDCVNKHVLHLVMKKHQFQSHMLAIKEYLLLSRGHFVQLLQDTLSDTLSQPPSSIYSQTLYTAVESTLRSTRVESDFDVLPYLVPEIKSVEGAVSGWEAFSFQYKIPKPLDVLVGKAAGKIYSDVFQYLWKVKRLEKALSNTWRDHVHLDQRYHVGRSSPLRALLVKSSTARNEMINFTYNYQYYLTFEGLESHWQKFNEKMSTVVSFEALLEAHEKYIDGIQTATLVKESSKQVKQQIDSILSDINQYTKMQRQIAQKIESAWTKPVDGDDDAQSAMSQSSISTRYAISIADEAAVNRAIEDVNQLHQMFVTKEGMADIVRHMIRLFLGIFLFWGQVQKYGLNRSLIVDNTSISEISTKSVSIIGND